MNIIGVFLTFWVSCVLLILPIYLVTRSVRTKHRHLQIIHLLSAAAAAVLMCILLNPTLLLVNSIILHPLVRPILISLFPDYNFSLAYMLTVFILLNFICGIIISIVLASVSAILGTMSRSGANLPNKFPAWTFFHLAYDTKSVRPVLKKRAQLTGKWVRCVLYCCIAICTAWLLFICIALYVKPGAFTSAVYDLVRASFLLPITFISILCVLESFLRADSDEGFLAGKVEKQPAKSEHPQLTSELREKMAPTLLAQVILSNPSEDPASDENDDQFIEENTQLIKNSVEAFGGQHNERYRSALENMFTGHHSIINDTFDGEFSPYLLTYLTFMLAQGKCAVIICRDTVQKDIIHNFLTERLIETNGFASLWRLQPYSENIDSVDSDILICTSDEIYRSGLLERKDKFNTRLRSCIFCDVLAAFSSNELVRNHIFYYLVRRSADLCCVFFAGAGSLDFETRLRDIFDENIMTFENQQPPQNVDIMIWRQDGPPPQRSVGLNEVFKIGTGLTLSLYALKYGIEKITFSNDDAIPFESHFNSLRAATNELTRTFFEGNSTNLDQFLSGNYCKDSDIASESFNIIYDTGNNIAALLEIWLRNHNEKLTMVHIISRSYLLRDYFCNNITRFYHNPSIISLYVPYETVDREGEIAALLLQMEKQPMYERDFLSAAQKLGYSSGQTENILEEMLQCLFGQQKRFHIYDCFSFRRDNNIFLPARAGSPAKFICDFSIRFTDRHLITLLREKFTPLDVWHNQNKLTTLPVSAQDVYNSYLPNQIHSFCGMQYKILSIKGNCIKVESTSDTSYRSYKSVSNVCIEFAAQLESNRNNELHRYSTTCAEARVKRTWHGYYELADSNNFSGDNTPAPILLNQPLSQTVESANVIELSINDGKQALCSSAILLFCFMFNELMPSLYPGNHQNIFACTELGEADFGTLSLTDSRILQLVHHASVSNASDSIKGSHKVYIVEFAQAAYGLARSVESNMLQILTIMHEYLSWALGDSMSGHSTYLHMGLADIPSIFAPSELLSWLSEIITSSFSADPVSPSTFDVMVNNDVTCDFCRKTVSSCQSKVQNGAAICPDCFSKRSVSFSSLRSCRKEASAYIAETYDLKPPYILAALYGSAAKIRAKRGKALCHTAQVCWSALPAIMRAEKGIPQHMLISAFVYELLKKWLCSQTANGGEDIDSLSACAQLIFLRTKKFDKAAEYLEQQYRADLTFGEVFSALADEGCCKDANKLKEHLAQWAEAPDQEEQ